MSFSGSLKLRKIIIMLISFILLGCSGNYAVKYPLHDAVYSNKIDKTQALIKSGADLNAYDSSGLTPLLYAVWYCNLDMVRLLTESGARTDIKSTHGTTSLHYVAECYRKNPETALPITQIILDKGCDMDAVDYYGKSALSCAFDYQADDMVAALRSKGLKEQYKSSGSFDESLRSQHYVKPKAGEYFIPEGKADFYGLAVNDCNFLGNSYKVSGPLGGPFKPLVTIMLADADAENKPQQFKACMELMGFIFAYK